MRLQKKHEFESIRRQGQRLVQGCLIGNWMLRPEGAGSKLGVVTSRKVGGATVRSRVRRWLRHVFRIHQYDLCRPAAIVLVARPSTAQVDFSIVERDFLSLLRRAQLLRESR
jgi:ribonuclease P protein component